MESSRSENAEHASKIVRNYTLLAMATGILPVPATSAVIIGEDAAMITHIAAIYGRDDLTPVKVVANLGLVAGLNLAGRALFIEVARTLLATGAPWALPATMAFGAVTAGAQTWVLGQISVAIAEHAGDLTAEEARKVVSGAKLSFKEVADSFRNGERGKKAE